MWSEVLLFSDINEVSIFYYKCIEFIMCLYTFLVISFARYKKYVVYLISFSKFSDISPTFTCVSAVDNL